MTKSLLCFSAASAPRAKIDVDRCRHLRFPRRELILPKQDNLLDRGRDEEHSRVILARARAIDTEIPSRVPLSAS